MKTLFFFFISFSLSAQIRGVVKDSISGEPIPFVNIWVENETVGTTSEADGTFFLEASKQKSIVISVLGYERKTLKGSEISEVFLKPTTYNVREVVILIKSNPSKLKLAISRTLFFNRLITDQKSKRSFFLIKLRTVKQSL